MKTNKPKKGKDGYYRVQRQIGVYPDGKRCYERFADKNWDSLLLQIASRKAEFAQGIYGKKREHDKPVETLLTAIDKYIETCRILGESDSTEYSPSTIAAYMSIRRSIEAHPAFADLCKLPVGQITVDALQTALNGVAKGEGGRKVSPKTLRNWWGIIKPAIDHHGPDIRLDKVRLVKNKRQRSMTLRESDIPVVLRIAREMDEDFFLYVLFTAVLGMRPSESYALTWGDISASPLTSIQNGKPQQYGQIFIDKACVCDEFGKYQKKGTKTESGTRSLSRAWSFFETLYAVRPRGKDDEHIIRLKPNLAPYRWQKLKQSVNLPEGMVMYDLRHYHASVMIACGAEARYVANDMGHSDIAITQRYYVEEIHEKRQEINGAMYAKTDDLLRAIR